MTCSIGDDGDRDGHDATDVAVVAAAVADGGSSAKEKRPSRYHWGYSFHFVVSMAKLEAVRLCCTESKESSVQLTRENQDSTYESIWLTGLILLFREFKGILRPMSGLFI